MSATEDLRERLTETLNTTLVTPEGGIERSTSKFDRHGRHNFLHNCAVCQGNVPAIVSTVLAALAGDPGDLPARMVEDDMDLRELIGPRLEAAQVRDADGVAALAVDVISPVLERLRAELAEAREAYLAVIEAAELRGTVRTLHAERDALKAAIEGVRLLHARNANTGDCEYCSEHDYPDYAAPWPCATIAALDTP